jgi:hypothetical protein
MESVSCSGVSPWLLPAPTEAPFSRRNCRTRGSPFSVPPKKVLTSTSLPMSTMAFVRRIGPHASHRLLHPQPLHRRLQDHEDIRSSRNRPQHLRRDQPDFQDRKRERRESCFRWPGSVQARTSLLTDAAQSSESWPAKRSEFGEHAVWVTRSQDGELTPSGQHTLQPRGGEGIVSRIQERQAKAADAREKAGSTSVRNQDIVVWRTSSTTHNLRVENWPVMAVDKMLVVLKPVNFFWAESCYGCDAESAGGEWECVCLERRCLSG